MSTTRPNGGSPPKLKIPLDGGCAVCVWENWREIPSTGKKRLVYSLTIQHRRYQDSQTQEWKSAQSLSPAEGAAVAWAISKALDAITRWQADSQTEEAGEGI